MLNILRQPIIVTSQKRIWISPIEFVPGAGATVSTTDTEAMTCIRFPKAGTPSAKAFVQIPYGTVNIRSIDIIIEGNSVGDFDTEFIIQRWVVGATTYTSPQSNDLNNMVITPFATSPLYSRFSVPSTAWAGITQQFGDLNFFNIALFRNGANGLDTNLGVMQMVGMYFVLN